MWDDLSVCSRTADARGQNQTGFVIGRAGIDRNLVKRAQAIVATLVAKAHQH